MLFFFFAVCSAVTLAMHWYISKIRKNNKAGKIRTYGVDTQKYVHAVRMPFVRNFSTVTLGVAWTISIIGGGFLLILCLDPLMEEPILFAKNAFSTFLAQNIPSFILLGFACIVIGLIIYQSLLIFFRADYFYPYQIVITANSIVLKRKIFFAEKILLNFEKNKPYESEVTVSHEDVNNNRVTYCFLQDEKALGISFPEVWQNNTPFEKSLYTSKTFLQSKVLYVTEPSREFESLRNILKGWMK